MTQNNNPFKIHIDLEELNVEKEEDIERQQKIDLIDKDLLEKPVNIDNNIENEYKDNTVDVNNNKESENLEDNNIELNSKDSIFHEKRKKPDKIPKINVVDIVTNGFKGGNVDLKNNILLKKVEERKKRKKFFKIILLSFVFLSVLSLFGFVYFKKDMVASILGLNVKVIKDKNYNPLDKSQFSPNSKFFYETYIRDYDYLYKHITDSKYKSRVLIQMNIIVSDFAKNKIDYVKFRKKYGYFVWRIYSKILQNNNSINKNKMLPLKSGGVKTSNNEINTGSNLSGFKINVKNGTGNHLSPDK